MSLSLPPEMEPFRAKLLETRLPFVRVRAGKARDTLPWESKVGGRPYFPKGAQWPCTPEGQPLFFLAQLNFAEMPPLPPFPERGIVQFFIHDDDLYGMDFDDGENPDTFRVLFHAEPAQDTADQQPTPEALLRDYDDLLPHHPDECYPLHFERAEEPAGMTDYRFYQHFGSDFFRQFGEKEWDVMDAFGKALRPQGHKVGGYAYFTQDDPRRPEDPMLLLFQLDSDEGMDLMWGDMGVGHFFIREKDLLARDFSRVLYDWDCL
jgi:uncharacterized protein YwqG